MRPALCAMDWEVGFGKCVLQGRQIPVIEWCFTHDDQIEKFLVDTTSPVIWLSSQVHNGKHVDPFVFYAE